MSTRLGRNIFAYKGIPYAKPPVGHLRFRRPEPLDEPWEGILDGSSHGYACPQTVLSFNLGQEDCLSLNVYVPADVDKMEKKLPVMVFIHGGGFVFGDGSDSLIGPAYLLDKDVILVTIQYRLGVLGFLNLGTEEVSGNQGLWDQREALRWVQRNIKAFGGDPSKVTLFGESAGGMSVVYHLISHQSEGLFQAAISMSGSPQSVFLAKDRHTPLMTFHQRYSSEIGCDSPDPLRCLQNMAVKDLLKHSNMFDDCNFFVGLMDGKGTWKPIPDSDYSSDPFFIDHPLKLIKDRKFHDIPVMIGSTTEDGLLYSLNAVRNENIRTKLKNDWSRCLATNILGKESNKVTQDDIKIIQDLESIYFTKGKGTMIDFEQEFSNMTNLFTDLSFAYPALLTTKSILEKETEQKVFSYRFGHLGSFSTGDIMGSPPYSMIWRLITARLGLFESERLGACHGDDMIFLFSAGLQVIGGDRDDRMISLMVDLWANFATFHHPTPKGKTSKRFIGESLRDLEKPWMSSKLRENGIPTYVTLKDAEIIFHEDQEGNKRHKRLETLWDKIAS